MENQRRETGAGSKIIRIQIKTAEHEEGKSIENVLEVKWEFSVLWSLSDM